MLSYIFKAFIILLFFNCNRKIVSSEIVQIPDYHIRGKLFITSITPVEKLQYHIIMRHNEKIWVRISGKYNIEAYRCLFTQYGLRIIDHINKRYLEKSYSEVEKEYGLKLDLALVEEIFKGISINHSKQSNNMPSKYKGSIIKNMIEGKLQSLIILNNYVGSVIQILYDYTEKRNMYDASRIYIYLQSVKKLLNFKFLMKVKNHKFVNKPQKINFEIPKKYLSK